MYTSNEAMKITSSVSRIGKVKVGILVINYWITKFLSFQPKIPFLMRILRLTENWKTHRSYLHISSSKRQVSNKRLSNKRRTSESGAY